MIVPTPAWPNFAGRRHRRCKAGRGAARFRRGMSWTLDLDKLAAAISPATRAIFINSPNNPTGWTATEEDLCHLGLARSRGLWIIADEVYSRFVFDGVERAPSFHDVMDEDDLVLFVNTFSKNWAMTGWRTGWISAPPASATSWRTSSSTRRPGVAAFMQRARSRRWRTAKTSVRLQIERARAGREIVCGGLSGSNRVRFAWPDGAFYLFFTVDGFEETASLGLEARRRSECRDSAGHRLR